MFEQVIRASEAMQAAAQQQSRCLMPALSGCPACHSTRMIAAPELGSCKPCGAELTLLRSGDHAL